MALRIRLHGRRHHRHHRPRRELLRLAVLAVVAGNVLGDRELR